jgi:hypothetical protein
VAPGPHDAAAKRLVVQRVPVGEEPRPRRVRRVEDPLREPEHGAQHRVLGRREDQIADARPVHRSAGEAAETRRRVDDRPPEEHGRPEEGQVLDVVQQRVPEGRLVGRRVMPAPKGDGVQGPRHGHPCEPAQQTPHPAGPRDKRAEAPPERRRQGPEDHRKRRREEQRGRRPHGQQLVLRHVGRERQLSQKLERRAESDEDAAETEQIGREAPARSGAVTPRPAEAPPASEVERG